QSAQRCGECDFVFTGSPALLKRTLARTGVSYERAAHAVFAVCGPGEEISASVFSRLVHVGDALHRYSTSLSRVISADHPVFSELDPEPIPPVALDHTWGAITGLTASIASLATVMEQFPPECWTRQGLLHGSLVSAIELANYGVHEAVHHLL